MVIPDTEWKEFIEGILTPPPLAFRIARTHRVGINFLEARKGAVRYVFLGLVPYLSSWEFSSPRII